MHAATQQSLVPRTQNETVQKSKEEEGSGGRTKWEPAAPAAHHVFKSLYDLKTKAKTNNRTFSIIYSSDVGSVLFDELPEFCARRASFVCACSLLYVTLYHYKRIFLCRLLSSIDTSEGETYRVSGTTKEPSSFSSCTVLSLVLCGQKVKHVHACPLHHVFSLCSPLVSSVTLNTRERNQNKTPCIMDLWLCRCE